MKIEKDHWVVACILAGLFAAFGLGVWWPSQIKLRGYQERIAQAQEELGPNFNQPEVILQREKDIDVLRAKIESSPRYVPQETGLATVLRNLTQAVNAQQIHSQTISTQAIREYKQYSEVPVELEFTSSFTAAYGVLREIETMPRLVRVDALSLRLQAAAEGRISQPRVEASYRLSSFFTGEPEEEL